MEKKIILVTGAPRSGTTPVGDLLTSLPKHVTLYEPLGPTGDAAINVSYFMPHNQLGNLDVFKGLIHRIKRLELDFKPQRRASYKNESFIKKVLIDTIGSRSKGSYILSKLQPFSHTLVWKDPHAVFTTEAAIKEGIPVVLTFRPALAQAASFKRLGWTPPVVDIYERFKVFYGDDKIIQDALLGYSSLSAMQSGAILWRMAYLYNAKFLSNSKMFLVHSLALEEDKSAVYERLFAQLGLDRKHLELYFNKHDNSTGQKREPQKVHDWSRSISHTNSYWKKSLTDEEIEFVTLLSSDLEKIYENHISI